MQKLRMGSWTAGTSCLGAVALLSLAGCNSKNEVEVPTANQVANSVSNAATTIQKDAGPAIKKAAVAVETAAAPAVKVAGDAALTGKVKGAIMLNQDIDSSKINIDVKGKEVIIRGRVKNPAQRATVQKIAKDQTPSGYKLIDQLQIEGAGVKVVPKKK